MPVPRHSLRLSGTTWRPDPEAILAAFALPVITLDRAGIIVFANAAAEQMFQARASHLLDHPLAEHIPRPTARFSP